MEDHMIIKQDLARNLFNVGIFPFFHFVFPQGPLAFVLGSKQSYHCSYGYILFHFSSKEFLLCSHNRLLSLVFCWYSHKKLLGGCGQGWNSSLEQSWIRNHLTTYLLETSNFLVNLFVRIFENVFIIWFKVFKFMECCNIFHWNC